MLAMRCFSLTLAATYHLQYSDLSMGRVFSYESIAADKVPQVEDFERASKLFIEQIDSAADGDAIDGGFIFGSVCRGTANIRSDFDALISLKNTDIKTYKIARDLTQDIIRDSNGKIMIEPIVYPKEVLASGRHEMDNFFGEHLISDLRLIRGNDPADYMTFAERPVRDVFADYVYNRARKLSNMYITSDPREVANNGLQRMLELPNSLGRKTLQALRLSGYLDTAAEASDKPAVYEQSIQIFKDHRVYDAFRELSNANNNYTALLHDTIAGRIDRQTYDDELLSLNAKMPVAIEWIRAVGRAILPILDEQANKN